MSKLELEPEETDAILKFNKILLFKYQLNGKSI